MAERASFQGFVRSHHCGELSGGHRGQTVRLGGWVHKVRDLGGLFFIDLRDKYGVTQLNVEQGLFQEVIKQISLESVLGVEGVVRERPQSAVNLKMKTGEVEVAVSQLKVLSLADELPFLPLGPIQSNEDLRLKYRYLEIRTPRLQEVLSLRSAVSWKIRSYFHRHQFVEVETPILYKTTPEGARDFVVPSRLHAGKVYALPQSPQTLKQLLMIGGLDRYFQLCRCFRDEDFRADRQPEFTQLDVELSFSDRQGVMDLLGGLIQELFDIQDFSPTVLSYDQAMERFGTDKPDLRFGLEHRSIEDLFRDMPLGEFKTASKVKSFFIPHPQGVLARKTLDGLKEDIKPFVQTSAFWFRTEEGVPKGGIGKLVSEDKQKALFERHQLEIQEGTWIVVTGEKADLAHAACDVLRRFCARQLSMVAEGFHFAWIVDFPLLGFDEQEGRFYALHHPFTRPLDVDEKLFMEGTQKDLERCKAAAYDLVCNGYELAGGSLRIYDPKMQQRMFEVLGLAEQEIQQQFGFFVEALRYGVPPHGGFALGLDRLIMLLAKADSIRDVMAFPKSASAVDLMSGAPSAPSAQQLQELHLQWKGK